MPDEKDWKLGPGLGRLHEAHDPNTGAPELVLTSDEQVDWSLENSWRVSLSCKSDPATVKMRVEEAPEPGEVAALANMLVLVTGAVTRVEDDPRLREHLTSRPVARTGGWRKRVRAWVRSWRGRAFTGVGVLALGAGLHGFQLACSAGNPARLPDVTDVPTSQEPDFINAAEPGATVIAYALPSKPYKKQALPPCQTTLGEEEINGGCWMDMNQKPPCYANRAEYKGKCYMPVSKDRSGDSPAQAVEP